MSTDPIVIVSTARTPLGRFQGELGALPAHTLGAHVIRGGSSLHGYAHGAGTRRAGELCQ
jgi:acetyl-CoA C-acetyltransferase